MRSPLRPMFALTLWCVMITSALDVSFDLPGTGLPPGTTNVGQVKMVPGHQGKGAQFHKLAHVRVPTKSWFKPDQGAIQFMVQPAWPDGDKERHTFVHLGGGDAHVTIFRHDDAHVRFVYKGNPAAWKGASIRTGTWKPGTWHRVAAAWQATPDNGIVLFLSVDGQKATGANALPLPTIPEWTLIGCRGPVEPADAVLDEVVLSSTFRLPEQGKPKALRVEANIDARTDIGPMPRTFSFVTPWNSSTNRIPFTQEHPYFRRFQEAGFDMVRLVAFSENWLWGTKVGLDDDGKLALDFSDFDTLLDMYRAAGAEPYIRLAYHMPKVLASKQTGKGHSYSPPRDLDEWTDFMRRIVTHCNVDRKLGIKYWVTMLNEADIPIRRGQATWESMYELYERTTRAVKDIDPTAKVGGPATCGPLPGIQEKDIRGYLRFCKAKDLPPDFICFHAYRRTRPKEYEDAILAVRRVVEEEWPGLDPEYYLDEWNLWVNDSRQNNEYAAAYLAASIHYQMRGGLTRSSIVSFNSHRSPEELANTGKTFQGPFHKGDAPVPSARFYTKKLTIGEVERPVLYTHSIPGKGGTPPYTFGRYRVSIPAGGCRLLTGTAQGIDHDQGDGTSMTVVLKDGDKAQTVLTAHAKKHEWREHDLDLSLFAGKTVDIEFRTSCGPSGNVTADHGVWGSPKLVAGDVVVLDFCAETGKATTGYVRIPGEWHEREPTLPLIKGNVLTPAYYTYVLLNQLRGQRLPVTLTGKDGIHESDTLGVLACRDGKTIRVLLWHFDPDRADYAHILPTPETTVERQVVLKLSVPPGSKWRVQRSLIDAKHSNAYTDYVRRKGDTNGGAYNLETGSVDVVDKARVIATDGALTLPITLGNLSVSLLELQPE